MPFKHTIELKVTFEYLGPKKEPKDIFRPRSLAKNIAYTEVAHQIEKIKPNISDAERAVNRDRSRLKSIIKAIVKQAGFEIININDLRNVSVIQKKVAITQERFRSGGYLFNVRFGGSCTSPSMIYASDRRFEMAAKGTKLTVTKSFGAPYGVEYELADPDSFAKLGKAINVHYEWIAGHGNRTA